MRVWVGVCVGSDGVCVCVPGVVAIFYNYQFSTQICLFDVVGLLVTFCLASIIIIMMSTTIADDVI